MANLKLQKNNEKNLGSPKAQVHNALYANEWVKSLKPADMTTALDTVLLSQQMAYIDNKLKAFNLPQAYDGSEAILAALQKALHLMQNTLTRKYFCDVPATLYDAPKRLLELIYYHYKYAQKNHLKITSVLQRSLLYLLEINKDEILDNIKLHDKITQYALGRQSLLNVIKDELIEKYFWLSAGPEAHVNLKLFDAKLYATRPENTFIRRRIYEMHSQQGNEQIETISEQISRIRLNKALTAFERKKAILCILKQHEQNKFGDFANKLQVLLIEAEKRIMDFFEVIEFN